jgi:signal peptidase II
MKSPKPAAPRKAALEKRSAAFKAKRRRHLIVKWSVLVVVAGICVGLALWTTYLADHRLVIGEVHKIFPGLSLQRSANNGVAFGLLGGNKPIILAANGVAILVVLAYVFMDRRAVVAGIGGGLIVGGSLGNIVQRLTGDGHVTDFIKFPYWPNFNMPDVFIVLGIVVVFLGLLVEAVRVFRSGSDSPASH